MRVLGEVCLLTALVTSGYSALACLLSSSESRPKLRRAGVVAGWLTGAMLTMVMAVLAWALCVKDFQFAYVAQYSSQLLPWHYSLSALWVGQAGSLLLWAWLLGTLTLLFRGTTRRLSPHLVASATGVLWACVAFLVAILVFAADPMESSIAARRDGAGLSPLLQHPSMLIHPPVVFAGYALWTIPFALAVAGLWHGDPEGTWTRAARSWALLAWVVLGGGILLGADWAYQELGWGGYWAWDPVENGSLVPWLTGTALIHGLMAWHYRGCLKKTTVALAIATFGLCNFATFLTRSGIFSSVHAFSESPIGWMFLGLMIVLLLGGAAATWYRRALLRPDHTLRSVWAREALILVAMVLLTSLTIVVVVGTVVAPVSTMISGRTVQFGPEFYNWVLMPVGLCLLALTAVVPLLRWGRGPSILQSRLLLICGALAIGGAVVAWLVGVRGFLGLSVAGLSTGALACLLAAWWFDAQLHPALRIWQALAAALRAQRRRYAGYVIHLGFVCLVVGVTGSSLGTRRAEFELSEGQSVVWEGRTVRHVALEQHEHADKLVAEAVLEVKSASGRVAMLRPARHLHLLQNEWTSEVAIDSTWGGDFYVVLHAGLGEGRVYLSFIVNPLLRWLWFGGWVSAFGVVCALLPERRRKVAVTKIASDGATRATKPNESRRRTAQAA